MVDKTIYICDPMQNGHTFEAYDWHAWVYSIRVETNGRVCSIVFQQGGPAFAAQKFLHCMNTCVARVHMYVQCLYT